MSVCFVLVRLSVLCWVIRCYSLALLVLSICFVSGCKMLFFWSCGFVLACFVLVRWRRYSFVLMTLACLLYCFNCSACGACF